MKNWNWLKILSVISSGLLLSWICDVLFALQDLQTPAVVAFASSFIGSVAGGLIYERYLEK